MSLTKRYYFEEINKVEDLKDEEYFYNNYKLKPQYGNDREKSKGNKGYQNGQKRQLW